MCNEISAKGESYIIISILSMKIEMTSSAAEPYPGIVEK